MPVFSVFTKHSHATRALERGIPPKVVQSYLGHSTIDVTMNIYTHVTAELEREDINRRINVPPNRQCHKRFAEHGSEHQVLQPFNRIPFISKHHPEFSLIQASLAVIM